MAKSIGALLRAHREAVGLSQVALARRLRISQQVLSRIESGARQDPRFSTIARAAGILGISLDGLAAEAGLGPRPASAADVRIDAEFAAIEEGLDRLRERVAKLRRRPRSAG